MPSREFMEKVLTTGRADDVEEEVEQTGPVEEAEPVEAPEEPEESEESEEPEESPDEEEPEGDEEAEDEEEAEGEEQPQPEAVEEVSDEFYLGTYRNREEAEKGWLEKEQHISNQAEEMHQMRERMAQYEGYLTAMQQQQQQQPVSAPGQFEEWAGQYFDADQAHAGWQEVVQAFQDTGDESYLDAYVEIWKEHDPYEASRMRNLLDTAAALNQQQQLSSTPPRPTAQDVINEAWVSVAETDPDLRDPEFAEGVGKILKNVPALRAAALSGDPEQVSSAISVARDGYRMQSARTGNGTPRKVRKGDAERLQQDKLAAAVTTGDSAPERGRASTPEVPPELQEMMQRIQRGESGFPKLRE